MEGGCFRQWRAGCNGISERLMTVKRAQTHPHKTDYPSVTEAAERGWVEGGRWVGDAAGKPGPMPSSCSMAGVEHEAQAVGPCPLPSSRGLRQILSDEPL